VFLFLFFIHSLKSLKKMESSGSSKPFTDGPKDNDKPLSSLIEVFPTLSLALDGYWADDTRIFAFADNVDGAKKYVIAPEGLIESLVIKTISQGANLTYHGIKPSYCYEYLGNPDDERFNYPLMLWMECKCSNPGVQVDHAKEFLVAILRELGDFSPVVNPEVDFLIEICHRDDMRSFRIKVPKIIFKDMHQAQAFWARALKVVKSDAEWRKKLWFTDDQGESVCFIKNPVINPNQLLCCLFAKDQDRYRFLPYQSKWCHTEDYFGLWRKSLVVQPLGTAPTVWIPDDWNASLAAPRPKYDVDVQWLLNHLENNGGWFIE